LVRVQATYADSDSTSGTGFLINERLVVTSRSYVVDPATGKLVAGDAVLVDAGSAGSATVERIHLTNSTGNEVVVLRLTEPMAATPLLLGYATLVRVGDQVHAPVPPDDAGVDWTLRTGVIDRFGRTSGRDIQLYRIQLQLPSSSVGGPVLDDLGEAIGIVMTTEADEDTYALGIDALNTILTEIGVDRDR
jgi:S1-C subfamily serine protease